MSLYFKTGTMNSSKTMNLIMAVHNYKEIEMNVLVFKSFKSDRGEGYNKIVSRAGGVVECQSVDESFTFNFWPLPDAIFVDESQFLTVQQVEELYQISSFIPVLCYGLKTNFKRELFPASKRLLELADSYEEFKSICECGKKATINGRYLDGVICIEGPEVLIEGAERIVYRAICRNCYDRQKEALCF